jgi:hypothetical protein
MSEIKTEKPLVQPSRLRALQSSLYLIAPLAAVTFVFFNRNWLKNSLCINNIAHHLGLETSLKSSHEWAEPYTMCVDPYWVNQWLKNYGAGPSKRGFLGEVAVHIFDGRINLFALNCLALIILALIAYGIVGFLVRIGGRDSLPKAAIFTTLLWLTPFGKSLSETAGDPLQVSILLLMLTAVMIQSRKLGPSICDLCLSITYCLSILIHEGSFLLLLPAYILLGRRTAPWWCGVGLALLITYGFSSAEDIATQSLIASRLSAYNPFNNLELSYKAGGGIASQVGFATNLKMEVLRYIKNPGEVVGQLYRTLVFILFFAMCFISWIQAYSLPAANKFLKAWLIYLPITLPFFFITHDWVRYGIINLLACLCCSAMTSDISGKHQKLMPKLGSANLTSKSLVSAPWIALLLLTILIGPHFNRHDIRTFPPSRLGPKYSLLFLTSIPLVLIERRAKTLHS